MGDNPNNNQFPTSFNSDVWDYINNLTCETSTIQDSKTVRKLVKVFDVFGRETVERKNTPLLYLFDDGVVEKKIIVE